MRWPAFLISAACAASTLASPLIGGISPRGVIPGKTNLLALTGSGLEGVSNLWTSFGPLAERVGATNSAFLFRAFCSEEARGVGAIQAFGPEGISEFALILIDPFSVTNSGAQLYPPVAIDGAFQSEEVDRYRFQAKAGEELSIEVLAHRMGSQADPVLQVIDAGGRELAFCDDDDSVWRDSRLRFKVPVSGSYTLALHDVGFGGGSGFFYRLRIGDFPIEWTQFPLRDPGEDGIRIGAGSTSISSPANPDGNLWFSSRPMLIEREPNDLPEKAQEFGPPTVLNGRFDCGADRDIYRFSATQGQKLTFLAQSRSLGSPCDVRLRILLPDGSFVAAPDARSLDEVPWTFKSDATGTRLLEVRELTGTAPAGAAYRVSVQNTAPSFRVFTDVNRLEISEGGTGKLKVTCERFDYDGEIRLEAEGISLENSVIPAGKKETEIAVKLPADGAFRHVTFTGKGTNGFEALVSTRPALRKSFPLMLITPGELDGRIAIAPKK